MRISVIVPAYNSARELRSCLTALMEASGPAREIIVVDDASTDGTRDVAEAMGVRVLRLDENSGPAVGRNRGARAADGDILFFVDADVVVTADAVERVGDTFEQRPELAAVFGSYDTQPRAPGILSQYRNLLHHYVHQTGESEAFTFWSGCGAVRRTAFDAVGGFDERAIRRSIEDIDLGYRLREAGYRILLDKRLQGTHLKRWTLRSMIHTDVAARAVPWTRLIMERSALPGDLNLKRAQQTSVALVALALVSMVFSPVRPEALILAAAALLAVAVLNRKLYAFFHRQRGLFFAIACFPLHLLYFVCSGLGFVYVWLDHVIVGHWRAAADAER